METRNATLVIMRGIPGSGKSTYVRTNLPGAIVCSADDWFTDEEGNYDFNPNELGLAHGACMNNAIEACRSAAIETMDGLMSFPADFESNQVIVIDNTNTTNVEMAPYVALAQAYSLNLRIVRIECDVATAAARNTHGVPTKNVRAMADRMESPLPWWPEEEVVTV